MGLINKLKEIIENRRNPEIVYNFESTGYENLEKDNLTRMFYVETFKAQSQEEQMKILQEQLNRLVSDKQLTGKYQISITSRTQNDVDLKDNRIKINPEALQRPIILYTQLAGIVERARQIEQAKEDPYSIIAIQLRNQAVHTTTGYSYDHSSMNPTKGMGSMYFNPTMSTNLKVDLSIDYLVERERQKNVFSTDYYIRRFQPTERAVALAMESAQADMKKVLDDDKKFDKQDLSRHEFLYNRSIIGNYSHDMSEYVARTKVPDIEDQIDQFIQIQDNRRSIEKMGGQPQVEFSAITDTLDTDIKLASINAFINQNNMQRTAFDPRLTRGFVYSPETFAQMSQEDFMRCFYLDNWKQLSFEEKKMLLQEQCNREAKELGLSRLYTVVFENIHDGSGAYHKTGEDKVHFNIQTINNTNPIILYGIIPHELTHARQDEIAHQLIHTTQEEYLFNANRWDVTTNITTPSSYHGQEITALNCASIQHRSTYFKGINPDVESKVQQAHYNEALYLYKLQPIEREAFEHQGKREQELKALMEKDHQLDALSQRVFNDLQYDRIPYIEDMVKRTYGCLDPTEAIRQFQSYACGLAKDYDPQTKEFDFALRFQAVVSTVYLESEEYPKDPRITMITLSRTEDMDSFEKTETLDEDDPRCQQSTMETPPWLIPGEVQGRMSEKDEQFPIKYIVPLKDEIQYSERTEDLDEPQQQVAFIEEGTSSGTYVDNEEFTQEDIQNIMDLLGETPEDEFNTSEQLQNFEEEIEI